MAKITINEIDNSSVSVNVGNENVVYVPGYAIKGPSNTPTLCTSVNEFKSIFGDKPYEYKNDQYYDGTSASALVARKHSPDMSYYYALELLKQGLPIMFERIVGTDGVKAALTLHFKDKIREAQVTVESAVYTAKNATTATDSWALFDSSNQEVGDAIIVEDVETSSVTITSTTASIDHEVAPIFTADGAQNESNDFTITAKYVGKYGSEIKVSIDELTDGSVYPIVDTRLFELFINNKRYVVNFDPTSEYYILTKLADDSEVDVTLNITSAYIESNLYGIINVEESALVYPESDVDEMTFAAVRATLKAAEDAEIPSPYYVLKDKTVYDVKFITSSVYASLDVADSTIASLMLDCAATRGDALAVIDIAKGISKNSYFDLVDTAFPTTYVNGEDRNKYGTIVAPSVKVRLSSTQTDEWMPASYAYLYALASSVKDNPIWYAISGVLRGAVSNFKDIEFIVDEGIANKWQAETNISINPIQNVRPYGYCIYGNRTLFRNLEGLTDSSFTNVRVLVNEAKKVTRRAITRLMFESNDNVLWNNFKALVEPVLQQMKSGRGITDYKITRVNTNKRATVAGVIKLMPVEAVENFEITFSLEDSNVVVE